MSESSQETTYRAPEFKVGDRVKVNTRYGLSQVPEFVGVVTFNDPMSPYIVVDGYGYRKYELKLAEQR